MTNKLILLFGLIIFTEYSFAQNSGLNTMTVEGKSKKDVLPDLCFISIAFVKADTSLKLSMEALNKNIKTISNVLKSYSIDTTDIRIAEYSITSETDNETKRKEYSVKNELTIEIKYNQN